jgi:hypothetical protein
MVVCDKRWRGSSFERGKVRDQVLAEVGIDIHESWTLVGNVSLDGKNWVRWMGIYCEERGWVLGAWINPHGTRFHVWWIKSREAGLEVIRLVVERSVAWGFHSQRLLDSFPELSALALASELMQDGKVFVILNEEPVC